MFIRVTDLTNDKRRLIRISNIVECSEYEEDVTITMIKIDRSGELPGEEIVVGESLATIEDRIKSNY